MASQRLHCGIIEPIMLDIVTTQSTGESLYDRLIQLCDSIATAEGVVDICERMEDIKKRYGSYPQAKWNKNIELLEYFEEKTGRDIYQICGK